MTRYLSLSRWWIEVALSLYGIWLGAWTLVLPDPFYWLGLSPRGQNDLGLALMAFSVIHAVGIRLNGGWEWSPLLRAAGLAGHAAIVSWITVMTLGATTPLGGIPSGFPTYLGISICLWITAEAAVQDMLKIRRLRHG